MVHEVTWPPLKLHILQQWQLTCLEKFQSTNGVILLWFQMEGTLKKKVSITTKGSTQFWGSVLLGTNINRAKLIQDPV